MIAIFFFIAVLGWACCAAAGRADEIEDEILNRIDKR